ncbi:hypothetical protein HO133_004661 [Letharia lupina]|uniref:MYND-type domain-containing protein n=1 Tax=Letharia lupina TaxID=560253 RepID=A0A8H6FKR0_9LECA|nr:uncharacterized protein HO133_004661 [Letharia lupina]KAF6230321.1 hypothetical protein HO133_004661 [Letharia lupina]
MLDEKRHWLDERRLCTVHIEESPYDCDPYVRRAVCHEKLGYPDLAAGDAYRALLLTDELLDESGEWHELTVEAIESSARKEDRVLVNGATNGLNRNGAMTGDGHSVRTQNEEGSKGVNGKEKEDLWYNVIAEGYARRSYEILARTLSDCGDLKAAYDFTERSLKVFPGHDILKGVQEQIMNKHRQSQLQKDPTWDKSDFNPRTELPENGSAKREIYPWNKHEIDRFSEDSMSFLNAEIMKAAPKCEVRAVELPVLNTQAFYQENQKPATITQLGVFATTEISPNETVLVEPSVLTSSTRLFDPLCDACSSALPMVDRDHPLPCCPDCDDTVFCSEPCLTRAQDLYHPAVCGLLDFDIVANDPSPFAASNALYTLLIARTLAMAETQDIHPLDLPQVKYLWGDFTPPGSPAVRTLPFSFENNIAQPLHLLSKLDRDPFAPEIFGRYDTWVINTLLAKFRGVANAKMNERTGMPEVAGVHWLWSLSNHSCAPNMRWAWEKGGMGLVARGPDDAVRWGEDMNAEGMWKGGIKKGDEVLTHYCDVELGVRQRREWAVGPLGGLCVCERCAWEEREEGRKEGEDGKGVA